MADGVVDWSEDTGIEVFLIARDSAVVEMYRMKLELDGYLVTTAAEVPDRKTARAGWRPDLVLIDLDGAAASRLADLQRLRSDPSLGNLPLLLLSTLSEEELRRRGVTLRPTEHILRVAMAAGVNGPAEEWVSRALAAPIA